MAYAVRTCNCCGIRLPQPQMIQQNIEVATGHSKKGLTAVEIGFAIFGNKNAMRSVGRTFTSPNKRKYFRNRAVWMCYSCAGVETEDERVRRHQLEKSAAEEKRISEERQKLAYAHAEEQKRISDYRRIANEYGAYFYTALFQLPLYCLGIYIPLVPMRMKTQVSTCVYVSLFYYTITVATLRLYDRPGFRWEIVLLGFLYMLLEYRIYSSAAKKGRKIPPPLKKTENL